MNKREKDEEMTEIINAEDRTAAQVRQEEVSIDLRPVFMNLAEAQAALDEARIALHTNVRYDKDTEDERLASLEMDNTIAQAFALTRNAFNSLFEIRRGLECKLGYIPFKDEQTGEVTRFAPPTQGVKP